MKQGKTLLELAQEITRQRDAKRDFLAPTSELELVEPEVVTPGGNVQLAIGGKEKFGMLELAHDQLGEFCGVPAKYYERMRAEAPGLLARNVNHWLHRATKVRLVRTLDGNARAFLSDGYRPLDYLDLAEVVLPVLQEEDLEIMSCDVTERRLYIKAVDKRINKDIPVGRHMGDGSHTIFHTSSPAIIVSDSEVGCGTLSVETGVWTHACTNLAVFDQHSMKKRHVGARHELAGDDLYHLLTDETRRATDKAVWLQVRDVVKGAFDEAKFDARCNELAGLAEQKIDGDPVKVVELTAKRFSLNEQERGGVLRHLIEGGSLTRYGLLSAVTRAAQDVPSYDRAYDLEKLGGRIIDLPQSEWQELAKAA